MILLTILVVMVAVSYVNLRDLLAAIKAQLEHQHRDIIKIMATQAELAADLRNVTAQLVKVGGETKALQASIDALHTRITELEAIVAQGGTVTQELVDAVAAVKAAAQAADDNVPDVTPPTTP